MLEEIILLRLEFAICAAQAMVPTQARFVPICRGMVFKASRTRH